MLKQLVKKTAACFSRQEGQTLTEYALILVFIVLGGVVGLAALASPTTGLFERALTAIEGFFG
ncbi:MAG TPA: hypothetical protein VGL76_06455 [Gaiellaceae bacterium]|jgi:Flp pilus assembly pilin Flp